MDSQTNPTLYIFKEGEDPETENYFSISKINGELVFEYGENYKPFVVDIRKIEEGLKKL